MTLPASNNIEVVGDRFIIAGQTYDLDTLILALQMERTENIDVQLADQANHLKRKNQILAAAQNWMGHLRGNRPEKADHSKAIPPAYAAWAAQYGIDTTDNTKQAGWDKMIEHLKAFIDSQNSSSQLDMIRLQTLMNKRNQSFDTMTNVLSKMAKSRDSIISNFR